jgi:Fic family protein
MQAIKEQDWQTLPESAQQELYDFFLFLKQRYTQQRNYTDDSETVAFSNHSANTIEQWLDETEDEIWK